MTAATADDPLPYPPDDPEVLRSLADRCARTARALGAVAEDLAADRSRLSGSWSGPAASACTRELGAGAELAELATAPLARASGLLGRHAATVSDARRQVDALRLARRDALAAPQPEPTVLALLVRRHAAVLEDVSASSAATARALAALAVDVPGRGSSASAATRLPVLAGDRRAAGVGAAPPRPGTAAGRVRAWWALLTDTERQAAVNDAPGRLGALAGLPVAVRGAANERRLALDLAALRRRERSGLLGAADQQWLATCRLVTAALHRARSARDPVTGHPLTAQLLVLAPRAYGGQGRVAIAVGDLDSADGVAFLVPGLGSDVARTLRPLTDDAVRLTTSARLASPAASAATVAWMGYDAPGLAQVPYDRAAAAGAALLGADVAGVRAARQVPAHLTLVGHSYGSTTVGLALREHLVRADDVVLLGSPGADVARAADLGVPPGHVFVGADSRDPVSYLGWFGRDPAAHAFGATRFEAEDAARRSPGPDLAEHGRYLAAHTESLANTARVVAGRYDDVVPAPARPDLPPLAQAAGGVLLDPETYRQPSPVP